MHRTSSVVLAIAWLALIAWRADPGAPTPTPGFRTPDPGPRPPARAAGDVLVSAATSLTGVVSPLAAAFERTGGVKVAVNLGSSNALARQIANGAPADLFISADQAQMDLVDRAGLLLPGTRIDWLSNQLAVVVPKGARVAIATIADLAGPEVRRIAVGDPAAVPAGVYARQFLESERLWTTLEPRLLPSISVRAALAAVESGNADAGIVYVTDARASARVDVAFEVPRDRGPRIVYPIALVRRPGASPSARAFYDYLLSAAGRQAAVHAGFIVLHPTPAR